MSYISDFYFDYAHILPTTILRQGESLKFKFSI